MAAKTSTGANGQLGAWGIDQGYLGDAQKKAAAGSVDPSFAAGIASGDPATLAFIAANGGGNMPAPGAMQGPAASDLTPTIMPFLTADDLISLNQFQTGNDTTLAQVDAALAQQQTDTQYQKQGLEKDATKATSDTQDQMAARGLFQSSIKDAALYDIQGQKTMRQGLLDDQMNNASLSAGRQKQIIQDSINRMNVAMNAKQVENAANASSGSTNTNDPTAPAADPNADFYAKVAAGDPATLAFIEAQKKQAAGPQSAGPSTAQVTTQTNGGKTSYPNGPGFQTGYAWG